MHLIGPLTSGINGAEGGSVAVTLRGTAQPTTIYRTFEGTDPNATGVATLDVNGSVELYVDTTSTVTVRDSQGNTVREFVAAASAPAVEIRSQSFTGQEYDDGSGAKYPGPGKPTNLQAVADRWFEVNGGTDWRVGNGSGDEFSLPDLVIALINSSIDVTSPQFGAKGDGINDDLEAFQLADAEATARGGATIFVPSTTEFYRWSNEFTLGERNNLLGLNADNTPIEVDGSTNRMLILPAGGAGKFVSGLRFQHSLSSNTGTVITVAGEVSIRGCKIGDGAFTDGNLIEANTGAVLRVRDCDFFLNGSSATVCGMGDSTQEPSVSMTGCRITMPVANTYLTSMFTAYSTSLVDCVFIGDPSGPNAGNNFAIWDVPASGAWLAMTGCDIDIGGSDGSGTGTVIWTSAAGGCVSEASNRTAMRDILEAGNTLASFGSSFGSLRTRETSGEPGYEAGTGFTILSNNSRLHTLSRTVSTDFTFGMQPADGLPGAECFVHVFNDSGGTISSVDPSGSNVKGEVWSTSITDQKRIIFHFIAVGAFWVQVATPLIIDP